MASCYLVYLLKKQSLKFTFSTDPPFQVFQWWRSQHNKRRFNYKKSYFYLLASDPGLPKNKRLELFWGRKSSYSACIYIYIDITDSNLYKPLIWVYKSCATIINKTISKLLYYSIICEYTIIQLYNHHFIKH